MVLCLLKKTVSILKGPLPYFEKCLAFFIGTLFLNLFLLKETISQSEFQCDLGTILIIYSGWLGLFLLLLLLFQSSQLFKPGKWENVKLSFCLTLIGSLIYINNFYFRTFGKHIEKDDLSLIYLALKSREIHLGWSEWIRYPAGFLIISFGLSLSIHLLRIFPRIPLKKRTGLKLLIGACLAAIVPFYFRDFVIDDTNPNIKKLKAAIPWESKGKESDIKIRDLFVEPTGYTIRREVEKKQYDALIRSTKSALDLPFAAKTKPNIVMIHVEGLRSDMVNEKRMPNLVGELNKKWLVLGSHFTTGLNTGLGIFGALSGLNGFYYSYFRKGPIAPFPLSVLKKLGYRNSVYFTKDLNYDRLYSLIFEKTVDETHHSDSSTSIIDQEIEMVDSYRRNLHKSKDNGIPRFDYIVMYNTHYTYFYPQEFEVNKPVLQGRFKITSREREKFREDAQKIKNRYLNSILFADSQVKKIIDALKETNRWENTIFVVFGDHGEEFWEQGSFGHTYKFVNQQAQTAAVIYFPTPMETKYKYTSHCDFMPTFFDYMGVNLNATNFMSGKSLGHFEERLDFCIVSKGIIKNLISSKFLIVSSGYKMQFQNRGFLRPDWIVDINDNPIETIDTRLAEKILIQAKLSKSLPDRSHFTREPDSPPEPDLRPFYYSLEKQELIDLLIANPSSLPKRFGKRILDRNKVVLARKNFRIKSEASRRLKFPFTVPQSQNNEKEWLIIANIRGAKDDKGDKGLYSWFATQNGGSNKEVFLDGRDLSVIRISAKSGSEMALVLEDLDTKFDGNSPGNSGEVEILAYPKN